MRSGTVVVAAALVRDDPPRLLAACRAHPPALAGRWELPGGKCRPGEAERDALVRECREELGVDVVVGTRVGPDVPTEPGDGVLKVWWARIPTGEPQALEHRELRWLTAAQLDDVAWLAADRPVIERIRRGLAGAST